jgi:hypothetical protein
MDFSALFKGAGKAAAANSPAILTALAVTGTLTTAFFAAKGAFKAKEVIDDAQATHDAEEQSHPFTTREKFDLTWKCYIPAAASAALTVAAIIGLNRMGERRAAAMAAAYSTIQKGYEEYSKSTKTKLGKTKEEAMRADIAQRRIDDTPNNRLPRFIQDSGPTMCFDAWSGRYFGSDVNSIDAAVNEFNRKIINDNYASLSDFWYLLSEHELPPTSGSDQVGWTTDNLLELTKVYGTHMGNPCLVIDFEVPPTMKYDTLY